MQSRLVMELKISTFSERFRLNCRFSLIGFVGIGLNYGSVTFFLAFEWN